VAKPLDATTKIKRPELPTIRCHESAASIMKNCPALSQKRVDLRRLLRTVKLRVDLPHLLRACLQRMPAIDYPLGRRPATAGRNHLSIRGLVQFTTAMTSSRRRMGRLRKTVAEKQALIALGRDCLRLEPLDLRHCRTGCTANKFAKN
jgi:hypothetical protein